MSVLFALLALPIIFFNFFTALNAADVKILKKPAPVEVKGIYLTAYTAGQKTRRAELIKLIENTELNAVVIDLKDYSGRVFFRSGVPLAEKIGAQELRIPDLPDLLAELKSKNIYTIARIAVFQDPYLAEKMPEIALKRKSDGSLWRDYKGLAWVDTASKEVWQYNIDLAKEAIALGFAEINFDYIRFPSDGPLKDIAYPIYDENKSKTELIADFFKFIGEQLKFEPAYVSVDLFGMTLWRDDGLGIGQRYQDAADYVDYICPMVYPSHYPDGFEGRGNPADFPYEIVYSSLIRANAELADRRAKIRPWLQAFDLGAVYDAAKIRAQIEATYDSGWTQWLLWNASNRYTAAGLLAE